MRETNLAAAIINQAFEDYILSGVAIERGKKYIRQASSYNICAISTHEESKQFLLGKTDISKFWFQVAGLDPLKMSKLREMRSLV